VSAEETPVTVWDYTEAAHGTWAEPLALLWSWGLNCSDEGDPWAAFLDLSGIAPDELGVAVFPWHRLPDSRGGWSFGYVELDYLADALRLFADRPQDCREWVAGLWGCEG
jgi:hypothetical protein